MWHEVNDLLIQSVYLLSVGCGLYIYIYVNPYVSGLFTERQSQGVATPHIHRVQQFRLLSHTLISIKTILIHFVTINCIHSLYNDAFQLKWLTKYNMAGNIGENYNWRFTKETVWRYWTLVIFSVEQRIVSLHMHV